MSECVATEVSSRLSRVRPSTDTKLAVNCKLRNKFVTLRSSDDLASDKPLPKYDQPPVVEVAISVFFKPLPGFKTAHFGRFWEMNRGYPLAEDHPPLAEAIPVEFDLLPPLRRVFLVTADNSYLMQVQPDFFAHNWRRAKEDQTYPSFVRAKELFLDRWTVFKEFVRENDVGELHLTRYEVTYVNQILEPQGAFPLALDRYTPIIELRKRQPEHFLPDPKVLSADLQFEIASGHGTLRVSLKHGVRVSDKMDVMQLDLSAVSSASPDGSNLSDWLETAHEWIVRGFTDLTTKEAHEKWKRVQ
jgi:uncharacterized protein (TIGR04255 family)